MSRRALWALNLSGTRLPLTGVKIPKIEKRGFWSQKPPFRITPGQRVLRVKKSPFLYRAPLQGKWGFLTRNTLFWRGSKWVFLTRKPSFPDFGDFDPCSAFLILKSCLKAIFPPCSRRVSADPQNESKNDSPESKKRVMFDSQSLQQTRF